jgi:serine/threonine-protein kinase
MELVDNGSLARRLGGPPLSDRAAAGLVAALARAVGYAHARGVLHRDLKPANVLLAGDGTPKLADFGLARLLDEPGQTASLTVLGTPGYMAPEQARGEASAVGPPADIYGLGAVLYEALTGRPPFHGPSREATLNLVVNRAPDPPSTFRRRLNRELEAVCLRCLEKNPDRRYGSADELAEDLDRFLGGVPTAARPKGRARRAWGFVRRHWVACAAVLLLASVGGAAWYLDPERPARAIAARLAAGQPVTLIGETGGPAWSQRPLGTGAAGVRGDGEFAVAAWDLTLLELVRDPQLERYRVRARVRHELNDNEGEVGIYACRGAVPVDGASVESFVQLTFNDVRPLAAPPGVVPPPGNPVLLAGRAYGLSAAGHVCDSRSSSPDERPLFKPSAGTVWRTLTLDVTPEYVWASWGDDGLPAGVAPLDWLDKRVGGTASKAVGAPWGGRGFPVRGGLGLFVLRATASFRSVTVGPLPE